MFRRVLDHPYFIWLILALPSVPMLLVLVLATSDVSEPSVVHMLLHPTGEFSARFLVITMILSPLRMLFPKSGFIRWMTKRRRYFGVAAFFYAAFHTVLYLIDLQTLAAITTDFWKFGIWTGWVAMVIFVPLAVTSTDTAVRKMGRNWKTLQRAVYVAAVATLLHWIFVHNDIGPALVHFVPLAGLEIYRVWRNLTRPVRAIA